MLRLHSNNLASNGQEWDSEIMVAQVIVVPIYWNRKPEEKARVVDAAEGAAKLLQGAGVATGVDTTNLFSPGQKFAFW